MIQTATLGCQAPQSCPQHCSGSLCVVTGASVIHSRSWAPTLLHSAARRLSKCHHWQTLHAEAGGCEGLADVVASCFASSAGCGKQTTTDIRPHTCSCCLHPVATQLQTVRIRLVVLPRSSWQLAQACCSHSERCTSGTYMTTHMPMQQLTRQLLHHPVLQCTHVTHLLQERTEPHPLPAAGARTAAGAGSTPETTASPSHARGSPETCSVGTPKAL